MLMEQFLGRVVHSSHTLQINQHWLVKESIHFGVFQCFEVIQQMQHIPGLEFLQNSAFPSTNPL